MDTNGKSTDLVSIVTIQWGYYLSNGFVSMCIAIRVGSFVIHVFRIHVYVSTRTLKCSKTYSPCGLNSVFPVPD